MTMTAFSRVYIIYNPVSTGGLAETRALKLAKRLERRGIKSIKTLATEYAGHGEELAYNAVVTHKNPLIISVSGDGGYNDILNGLMRAKNEDPKCNPVCAVLAAGNANDHRRSVRKQPLSRAITHAKPEPMDILKLTATNTNTTFTHYAHSYIGLGLTSQAVSALNKESLTRWKELLIVLRTIFHFDPVKIIDPSGKERRYDSLVFANIHQMSKVFRLGKKTPLTSGKFRVVAIPHRSRWRMIFTLLSLLLFGVQEPPQIDSYSFTMAHNNPIHLDGEDIILENGTKITIELANEAVLTLR